MYTFSGKLKTVSLVLMIIGALGIGYGFFSAPKTTEDVEQAMAHDDGHHGEQLLMQMNLSWECKSWRRTQCGRGSKSFGAFVTSRTEQTLGSFFIAAFFFLMISVCVLVFYAIQWAAQAGWSIVLFRIMEGITAYILPGSILLFIFLLFSGFHMNHIYVWMAEGTFDPSSENYDAIIAGKSWWLNTPGWLIRSFIYLFVYNIFRFMLRKNSLALDESGDIKIYKKNFNLSVAFIVMFGILELFMSFDWLMSLDPHWYSQLYSFYVFASVLVSAITTIALVTIYLKIKVYCRL